MTDNATRIEWAASAMHAFSVDAYCGRPFDSLSAEEKAECMTDMLANLRHLADAEGLDFESLDRSAAYHHAEESREG